MTYEKFIESFNEGLKTKPKYIRPGQYLMNKLYKEWNAEYIKLSSVHYYDQTDIDCYYNDSLIENTKEHLKKVWINFPN